MVRRETLIWDGSILFAFLLAAAELILAPNVALAHWYVLTLPMIFAGARHGRRGALLMSSLSLAVLTLTYYMAGQSFMHVTETLTDLLNATTSPVEAQRIALELADLRVSDPTTTFQRALIGFASIVLASYWLGSSVDRLEDLSWTDGLTALANRRRFDEALADEWSRGMRSQSPLSIVMIDVDHFKNYNDTFGHARGDEVLRRVAGTLKDGLKRAGDLAARYGGEEFVLLLPHTSLPGVQGFADRLRASVEGLNIPGPDSSRLTISLGVASAIPKVGASPEDLVNAADQALYRAKEGGRNRVAVDLGEEAKTLVD